MTFGNISRRKLLGTTAAGAATLSFAATSGHAAAALPSGECGHGESHARIGKSLAEYVGRSDVSDMNKNMALRTTSCPGCNTHLAPAA